MCTLLAVAIVAVLALFPLLVAAGFAGLARNALRIARLPADRLTALPLFLPGFAGITWLIAGVTLTFRPEDQPTLLNPVSCSCFLNG